MVNGFESEGEQRDVFARGNASEMIVAMLGRLR